MKSRLLEGANIYSEEVSTPESAVILFSTLSSSRLYFLAISPAHHSTSLKMTVSMKKERFSLRRLS